MRRPIPLALGAATLAAAWAGPLPTLAGHLFSAHMAMHMAVVAVAAPLLALGVDPARWPRLDRLPAPLPASMIELVVVWVWHAPALRHAAHGSALVLAVEQASFLGAGLLLWLSVLGRGRGAAGVVALLLTSVHMTLLGVLLTLATRPLYDRDVAALPDQQLGGILMLAVGGVVYLVGGLYLLAGLLRAPRPSRPAFPRAIREPR